MKSFLIITVFLWSNLVLSYPVGIKGQSQTSSTYPSTVLVPASQATLTSSGTLIETGNENMLVNAGGEASTATGWTCTVGTCTTTSTAGEFSSGKRALKVALSAQAMNVSQTVNTPSGIQKQGVVGVVYRVPSTMTDFQICSLVDAAEQTCVPTANLIKDDLFHSIEVPVTFGSTSAGIKFKTTSTFTANAFFDAAYVKQGIGFQNLITDVTCSVNIQNNGAVSISSQSVPDCISSVVRNSIGNVSVTFPTGKYTSIPSIVPTAQGGQNRNIGMNAPSTSGATFFTVVTTTTTLEDRQFSFTVTKTGNDYLAASANVYSQASANYDWEYFTPTINGAGTTNLTNACRKARVQGDMYVSCYFTTAGTQTSPTTFVVPDSLTIDSTRIVAQNTTAAGGESVGLQSQVSGGSATNHIVTALGTSSTLLYFSSGYTDLVPKVGSNVFTSGFATSLNFKIPISGWTNSNVIVGSFDGIEKCANEFECSDTFSAKVAADGTVSGENVDWLSTTDAGPTDTSLYTLTFNSGIFSIAPNCWTSQPDTTGSAGWYNANQTTAVTTTTLIVRTTFGDATTSYTKNAKPFSVFCQKAGIDYKPKTAKIATSIGVPTVPGIVGISTGDRIDTFFATFGTTSSTICSASPCGYLDQIGTAVSSVTRSSTGRYTLNTAKTYTKLKCSIASGAFGNGNLITPYSLNGMSCSNCSSLSFDTYNQAAAYYDALGNIICQGSY